MAGRRTGRAVGQYRQGRYHGRPRDWSGTPAPGANRHHAPGRPGDPGCGREGGILLRAPGDDDQHPDGGGAPGDVRRFPAACDRTGAMTQIGRAYPVDGQNRVPPVLRDAVGFVLVQAAAEGDECGLAGIRLCRQYTMTGRASMRRGGKIRSGDPCGWTGADRCPLLRRRTIGGLAHLA